MWLSITDQAGKHVLAHTKKDSKIRWKRKVDLMPRFIDLEQVPGYFKPGGKKGSSLPCSEEFLADYASQLEVTIDDNTEGGNARIENPHTSKGLDHQEISDLKSQGLTGDEMIEQLQQGNSNFEKRTEFSKAKYIRKKKQRYNTVWKIEKCSLLNVFGFFRTTKPKDMIIQREDAFNIFCHSLDIQPDSRVFLVEKTKGCLLSYVVRLLDAERFGHCYLCDFKNDVFLLPVLKAISYLNLNEQSIKTASVMPPAEALALAESEV